MTKATKERERPDSAIFADGSSKRSTPLAIHPEAIGVSYPTRQIRDRKSYELRDLETCDIAEVTNGVAVLSIDGPLEHKGGDSWWCFWQNYEDLAADFSLIVNDPAISAVVLKFDSPGGECAGLNETVAIMQAMKRDAGKPVIAYVDEACYSAAYALAMVADEIYLPESGGVGSIGVITAMCDVTKLNEKQGVRVEVIASGTKKTDGHPAVALTDGAIKRTRRTVDKLAAAFFDLVSAGRGLAVEAVQAFEAGTFMGQDAVDAGLADGVMSLSDCLTFTRNEFSSSNSPNDRSEGRSAEKDPDTMPGKIAAAKATSDANKALVAANAAMTAAKTDGERALAAARILAAEDLVAKVKKTKTVTTDTHEEEVDDGEEEAKDPPPSKDDEGDDDEGDDDEGDEKDEDAKASVGEHTTKGLLALARRITGKKSIDEVMGALHATWQSSKKSRTLESEVAALKADAERTKVSALVASGVKAGKLAPSQRAWARTQTPASLKAYLDAAPKMVHTPDDEHTEARVEGAAGPGVVTAEMARIWRKLGHAEKDFPALLARMNGTATHTNGAS